MEIGRVADIDQAKANHVEKIQTVKEVDDKEKVIQDDQYKKVQGNVQEIEKGRRPESCKHAGQTPLVTINRSSGINSNSPFDLGWRHGHAVIFL